MSVHHKPRVDDDEDLDDLDDVLDQFSPPAQPTSPPGQAADASTSAQPAVRADGELSDDFTAELAKQMASLFSLGAAESKGEDEIAERERLAAAWEAMLAEGMDAVPDSSGARTSADASSSRPTDDFQSRIRSTMNKLKESESGLKPSDATGSGGGIEPLLSYLDGDGAGNEEQLQGMLEQMMEQLMSKDVLYEPLKELHDKFPEYLGQNRGNISPEDNKRFEAQTTCIKRLLDEFGANTYRDDDDKARKKIVDLMGELQTHGSPPEEIMGPLPPGLGMAADGLPDLRDGCTTN